MLTESVTHTKNTAKPIAVSQLSAVSLTTAMNSFSQSAEELAVEQHFHHTTTRNEKGQFVVRLPFKRDPLCLGNSRVVVKNRLLNLERKLGKDHSLVKRYDEFLMEYLSLEHMEKDVCEIRSDKY